MESVNAGLFSLLNKPRASMSLLVPLEAGICYRVSSGESIQVVIRTSSHARARPVARQTGRASIGSQTRPMGIELGI